LVQVGSNAFVDIATGMVLSRLGWIGAGGYELVTIDGVGQKAHRVVAAAVHGPIPEGYVVNHLDADPANNHPANLEVTTQSGNVQHTYDTGRRTGNGLLGTRRCSKLTDEQVDRARAAKRGELTSLAKEFGVAYSYLRQVKSGRKLARHGTGGQLRSSQTNEADN
jgi:hypothetical protein